MFITLITDCNDSATFGRQLTRISSLFDVSAIPVSINGNLNNTASIEAAGILVDMLDSSLGKEGIVLVNAAPRNQTKWPNGTPFGYFYYKNTLVVSTVDGNTLSLVKKLSIAENNQFYVFDIPTVMEYIIQNYPTELGDTLEESIKNAEYIKNTQFRSFEFMPRVAKWKFDGLSIPESVLDLEQSTEIDGVVFWIDNFGNVKTTALPEEIGFEVGKKLQVANIGEIMCYSRLKDVPIGSPALIVGSSGIGTIRFVELVIQGESAAKKYNLQTGDKLFGI